MKPTYPRAGSQERMVLDTMLLGSRLTHLEALDRFGIWSLSQRCTRLRQKYHWPVRSRMIVTPSRKRVALYWIERAR
ncbi:MAG: helix-turn-helix domain-containing protein [Acidobacteriaceae bacterium]